MTRNSLRLGAAFMAAFFMAGCVTTPEEPPTECWVDDPSFAQSEREKKKTAMVRGLLDDGRMVGLLIAPDRPFDIVTLTGEGEACPLNSGEALQFRQPIRPSEAS